MRQMRRIILDPEQHRVGAKCPVCSSLSWWDIGEPMALDTTCWRCGFRLVALTHEGEGYLVFPCI